MLVIIKVINVLKAENMVMRCYQTIVNCNKYNKLA